MVKSPAVKVYARDRLTAPLAELGRMLELIRSGSFDPDAPVPKAQREEQLLADAESSEASDEESEPEFEDEDKDMQRVDLMCRRLEVKAPPPHRSV
eukprot:7878434-Karenia_brevis.AAC.1